MADVPFERHERVRIGLIGCGGRGGSLLGDLLNVPGVEVRAVCDVRPERAARAAETVAKRGGKAEAYDRGPEDYARLTARDDLDLVYIATPWEWHVPMAVRAMRDGKHAGVEVPAATTLEECWALVDASEATRRHCVILENCCYGYSELAVLRMARAGLFGTLTHAEAAYIHDLREILTVGEGEALWRRAPHTSRDANLYPTHGLGPVANYLDANRGDRFATLVSLSSREAALSEWVAQRFEEGDPKRAERYVCGDMNTSILRTTRGRTVLLQHDVVTPRPYSRLNLLQGTKGTFADYPARVFLDGQEGHDWRPLGDFKAEWEHPLWTKEGETARKLGGHGGMDYIMSFRLVECMKEGKAPDMDVYDAAAWSAPTPLSEASNAAGGAPQLFPDFTRGAWESRPPVDL